MQLDCPICRGKNAVDLSDRRDADVRLDCAHCGAPLILDTYAGRLAPDRRGKGVHHAPEAAEIKPARRADGFFQPRLSEGRDIPAIIFVITCLIVIVMGGLRLTLNLHAPAPSWSRFDPRPFFDQVEGLVARFMAGESFREGSTPKHHLARGKRMVQSENYAQGLRELDAALAADPDNFESHFWRGRALVKMHREAEAIAAFEAAIALNPDYSYAYDNLGWIYLRRNDYAASLEYLDRSLALRPDNAWAYYNRGRVRFQLGQEEAAFQDAEAACRLGFEQACEILRRYDRDKGSP